MDPRIAIVHEWLVTVGGSELVVAQFRRLFPEAVLFALVDKLPATDRQLLGVGHVQTSFLQRFPSIERSYRRLLPVFPAAIRSLDVRGYDIVLSSSHSVAKGVRTHTGQLHVCFCHSPMRYAWDLREQYLRESGNDRGARGLLARALLTRLREWDRRNSADVDSFIANSSYIADRIRRAYGRSATVIYPPVDTEFFTPPIHEPDGDYYVTASRFVPYKRVDLIARAFRHLPKARLVVVGSGPDEQKVRNESGPNVELLGHLDRARLRDVVRNAKAFIFAAEEDFGIAPVEAQACGVPVIAFGRGGARETIVDDEAERRTGVFFSEQSDEAIADAVRRFEATTISRSACRANAERFGEERFRREIAAHVDAAWQRHQALLSR